MRSPEANAVESLIRASLPAAAGYRHDGEPVIVAVVDDEVIAAAVLTVTGFDGGSTVLIRYLAVEPGRRGKGLATVILGVSAQSRQLFPLPTGPCVLYGNCDAATASLYASAGFNVLEAHQPLPIPFAGVDLRLSGDEHPHWFFRVA